jgi:hypothetical protein
MAQFSMKIMRLSGSLLSGNQHIGDRHAKRCKYKNQPRDDTNAKGPSILSSDFFRTAAPYHHAAIRQHERAAAAPTIPADPRSAETASNSRNFVV